MAAMHSYELNGKKLSFSNWISNLSPTETPFTTMTGKEATDQTSFYWQTDRLAKAADNAVIEGADATDAGAAASATTVEHNFTQILRKSFKVSDTADVMANYGRGREVSYQMEKFATALKRDLETILLSDQAKDDGSATSIRKTAGFQALVATQDATDSDTGAKVHFKSGTDSQFSLSNLQEMTYNLYLAGSEASVIMFHPKHAAFFASLQGDHESSTTKMFDGDTTTFSHYVNTYIDEFGRSYKLVPNRFMPEDAIYFFQPTDFTQMVLRAPQRTELAKKGNYQHWMLEMEVGLRLRDKFAAGVLKIEA